MRIYYRADWFHQNIIANNKYIYFFLFSIHRKSLCDSLFRNDNSENSKIYKPFNYSKENISGYIFTQCFHIFHSLLSLLPVTMMILRANVLD